MVSLLDLTPEKFKQFLDSFDHVFSDCDGVIWLKDPIPGSSDFLKLMEKLGKTVHFVSNNSMRDKANYEAIFKAAGIENGFERLTTPSVAIAEYLKSVKFDKHVYCVTCQPTIAMLESYGFKCKSGPEVGSDYYEDYLTYWENDDDIGAVVIDSDFKLNIPKLYKASAYLRRPEVLFINGLTDKLLLLGKDIFAYGPPAFTSFVEEMSNRKPIALGKPGKAFGEFAMRKSGVTDPSRVLFIGDLIEQDICLGKNVGFKTLLVLTNITKENMLKSEIKPDYYAPSLGSILPKLQEL